MAITLANLMASVNAELENRTHFGMAEVVADGVKSRWNIAPLGYDVINDNEFIFLADGTERTVTTEYVMDFSSGVCTYREASAEHIPDAGVSLKWYFNYKSWSDAEVTDAINAAIQSLFPAIYCEKVTEVTVDGTDDEYDLGDAVEFVKAYDWKSSSDTTWTKKRHRDFELFRDDTHKVISFFSAPAAGTVRLHTISRPTALATTADDLAGDALIPERTAFPIISYACYYLLTQKTAPRARGDVAITTQGSGTLSPRQMNDAANAFYMRYQMQLASIKMPPWSMR